jgi:VWFA-related protein
MAGVSRRTSSFVWVVTICFCLVTVYAAGQRGSGGGRGTSNSSALNGGTGNGSVNQSSGIPGAATTAHAEDEGKIEFKSDVVLIQVPATVVDKSGNHVRNLKQEDFEVLENGKPQTITSFQEITAGQSPFAAPKTEPGEFRNLSAAQGEQPRSITVFALDAVNTPFLDQTYGRKQLLKYLSESLDPTQAFAVVVITSDGLKVIHGLTGDAQELIEALKKVSSENPALTGVGVGAQVDANNASLPLPGPAAFLASSGNNLGFLTDFVRRGDAEVAAFKQQAAIETTMNAFLAISWSLSGLPGKKSVIWATGGLPFFLDSPSTLPTAPGAYLSELWEHTLESLNESNISVYPVDVRGLETNVAAPQFSATRSGSSHSGGGRAPISSGRSWLTESSQETLRDFAAMTGGFALYNNNDISNLYKRAVADSSSYYLIGYYLDTKNTKPGWRKLKVRLKDKEQEKRTEVRARTGFLVTNATVNPDLARQSDLNFALHSPFDSTGLPITVRWLSMAADGSMKKVQFGLQLPPNSISLGSQNLLDFDYMALAFPNNNDKEKKDPTKFAKTIHGNLTNDQAALFQNKGGNFKNEMELAPGDYMVRFVVRDDLTGRVGSVTAPLTVN